MKHRNILLVDDDINIRELVSFFLTQAGFVVKAVQDGFTALADLQADHFDLIILDISMPHMNGYKVLKSLKSLPNIKEIPVIVLTASQSAEDFEKLREEVSDYVIKPPDRHDLLGRIERIFGGLPQFQEVIFDEDNISAQGVLTVPVQAVSMSHHGLVIRSPIPVDKNFVLESLFIDFFKDLKLKRKHFRVVDCTSRGDGTYEYFISFLGMGVSDKESLHRWLMDHVFQKNKAA